MARKTQRGTRRRLGRGLESLIGTPVSIEAPGPAAAPPHAPASDPAVSDRDDGRPVDSESGPGSGSESEAAPSGQDSGTPSNDDDHSAAEHADQWHRDTEASPNDEGAARAVVSIKAPDTDVVETDLRPDSSLAGSAPTLPRSAQSAVVAEVVAIPTRLIERNPNQPRQHFDEDALSSLADSIRTAGLMQPIVVRPPKTVDGELVYELVAGERRLRAARLIPLDQIPAVVRDIDEQTSAELALIENLQREDLNPIERAEAFRHLADTFGLTQQQIADIAAIDRSSVSNFMRLNELDAESKDAVRAGSIGMGHARSLLSITDLSTRARLRVQAISEGWSVRVLERRVRENASTPKRGAPGKRESPVNADPARLHMDDLERRLGEHLGTRVTIVTGRKKGSGELRVQFFSFDEFEGLMQRLDFDAE